MGVRSFQSTIDVAACWAHTALTNTFHGSEIRERLTALRKAGCTLSVQRFALAQEALEMAYAELVKEYRPRVRRRKTKCRD